MLMPRSMSLHKQVSIRIRVADATRTRRQKYNKVFKQANYNTFLRRICRLTLYTINEF